MQKLLHLKRSLILQQLLKKNQVQAVYLGCYCSTAASNSNRITFSAWSYFLLKFTEKKEKKLTKKWKKVQLQYTLRHLKVKDTEEDTSVIKYCCITISMQKISSTHKFIYHKDTEDFRVSWNYRPHPFLSPLAQNLLKQLLAFWNLYQLAKYQFIPSAHREIQSILEYREQTGQTHFWPCQTKTYSTKF